MSMRLASTFVLVLGIAVFADSALAGNGQGNGNGNTPAAAASVGGQDSSPGNSANAPGQAKKDAGPASSEPAAPADVGGTEASSPAADGVKPSSESDHDTHEAASSDRTKQYGNGRTAGEIAIQHGAAPSAILHGPGNSQPHKAAPCSGGHEIDVHALKGKGHRGSCGPTPSPPSKPVPTGNPETNRSSDPRAAGGDPARPSETTPQPKQPSPKGPVSPSSGVEASSGVLAATQSLGRGTLPFTGIPLWLVAMGAVALIVVGLGLRRQAAAP